MVIEEKFCETRSKRSVEVFRLEIWTHSPPPRPIDRDRQGFGMSQTVADRARGYHRP